MEEVLQLLRKQDSVLNNPEKLLPEEYFRYLYRNCDMHNINSDKERIVEFFEYIIREIYVMLKSDDLNNMPEILSDFINFAMQNGQYFGIDIPDRVYVESLRKLRGYMNKRETE